jgi:GNAT superfamily N-acetyltransferase
MGPTFLRAATPADYGLYVRFQAELGVEDPPLPSERWEKESVPGTAFLVAEGVDAAYAFWDWAPTGNPGAGPAEEIYVRHLVVEAHLRGRGLGRCLMVSLARRFREQGALRWRLNVLRTNRSAVLLYESMGLRPHYSTAVMRLPWALAGVLPMPAASRVRADESPDTDDADLERRFGLLSGQISRARGRAGVRVIVTRETDDPKGAGPLGLAVFDPSFPGTFPFRCESPAHLGPLVKCLAQLYSGESPYVQLVVEDAPSIADALASAGAARIHDIVHMRGELPR